MPRRKISFDVAVNIPSAQREADRIAAIFKQKLGMIKVGTTAGGTGGAGGGGGSGGSGGGSKSGGMPGSSLGNLIGGSAQFALAGMFYKFYSDLPKNIMALDTLATTNKRATASFVALAGGAKNANEMIDGFIQGSGGAATRVDATTDAMRLFNIGMAKTGDQMRVFTTLSRGMGQSLGRPTEYIQEQFSLALANQSLLRFDQLGLSIERHQELVAELSEKYPTLTNEMVFQNAMLTQAMEKYYNLATAQEALATSTELASVALQENQAILAEWASTKIVQPLAGDLAGLLGSDALNLQSTALRNGAQNARGLATAVENGTPRAILSNLSRSFGALFSGQDYTDTKKSDIEQMQRNANTADALANALDKAQAAKNLGLELPTEYIDFLKQVESAMLSGQPALQGWEYQITNIAAAMDSLSRGVDPLKAGLLNAADAAAVLEGQIEGMTSSVVGAAAGMVQKLIKAGMPANQAIEMAGGSEKAIEARTRAWGNAGAFGGDALSDAAAEAALIDSFTAGGDAWIDAAEEAKRAQTRAASELEQAAAKAEKAFTNAADSIMSTFDDMLHKIPGVFGTSDVTDEDLMLAEKGASINYADDYLRRVNDVAFNKKKRDDVDMGLVRQALGLGDKTSDEETAIRFGRAWESGSLWKNPENIQKFMNIDAAKGNLKDQEMAALGQQNLKAFFGLGTEQGNEFLRVFGIEALDPIQDGLITEISTRGPIMGETLANAIHTGFTNAALRLPWIQSLMNVMQSEVGRKLMEDMNTGANSDLAETESITP